MQKENSVKTFIVTYEDRIIFPYEKDYKFYTIAEVMEKEHEIHPEMVKILIQALQVHSVVELMNEIDYNKLWQSDCLRMYRYVL